MSRKSYRVQFPGDRGNQLSGIVDRPDHLEAFPVAVFSHCFTCSKDLKAIVRISRSLAELGVAVLRFDMSGLGGSGGDFSRSSFSTNVADLRLAIKFAESEFGGVTSLIGHSFGGAASLAVGGDSESEPNGIRAIVTLAAPSDTQHLAVLLASMDPAIESEGIGTVSIGGRNWTIRNEMLEDFRSHDLPAAIGRIDVPTLLLHSPVDATVGFDHALRIMGLIQSSDSPNSSCSLVALNGADHLLANQQVDIDFVASTTAAFLQRYAQPGR